MNSACCESEVVVDWELWRCGKCKKPLIYNTLRCGTLEAQITEKPREIYKLLQVNDDEFLQSNLSKQVIAYIFDWAFMAGKNGWNEAYIFFEKNKSTEIYAKLKRGEE